MWHSRSSSESAVAAQAQAQTDAEAPPHPLRDVVDTELRQLRSTDMAAPFYDPDWD